MAGKRKQTYKKRASSRARKPKLRLTPPQAFMAGILAVVLLAVAGWFAYQHFYRPLTTHKSHFPIHPSGIAAKEAPQTKLQTGSTAAKETLPAPAATAKASTERYLVQLHIYNTFKEADSERAHLILAGYTNAQVKKMAGSSNYALMIGPYPSHNQALQILREVNAQYVRSKIIKQ